MKKIVVVLILSSFSGNVVSAEVSDRQGAYLENALVDCAGNRAQSGFQSITPPITRHMRDAFDDICGHFVPGWLFFIRRAHAETNTVQIWYQVKNFDQAKRLEGLVDSDTTIQVFKMVDQNFCH